MWPRHRVQPVWRQLIVFVLGALLLGVAHCAALLHGPSVTPAPSPKAATQHARSVPQPHQVDATHGEQSCALGETELQATTRQATPTGVDLTGPVGTISPAVGASAAAQPTAYEPKSRATRSGRSILATVCRWRI